MSSAPAPVLSVVLPSYRGEPLAHRAVAELRQTLAALPPGAWEIVVVDDGAGDFGPEWSDTGAVRVVRLPRNRGKGAAVRAGMRAARGRARVYTDVDLPYDPALILVAADYILSRGFHLVIGDRTLPGAVYHEEIPLRRKVASYLASTFIGRLVTGGFFDTQCGLKGVRGDVADLVFPLLRIERFAFDVELIYVALLHRLDIKRIPVRLRSNEASSVRVLRDCSRAAVDVLRIKVHQLRNHYTCRSLHHIIHAEFRAADDAIRAGAAPCPPEPAALAAAPETAWTRP